MFIMNLLNNVFGKLMISFAFDVKVTQISLV